MTPEEIHDAALQAAVKAIEHAVMWRESLTGGSTSTEGDQAIRLVMRRIAVKVGRGTACDLSYDPSETSS